MLASAGGRGKEAAGSGRTLNKENDKTHLTTWILAQVLLDHRYERVNYARLMRLALGSGASCAAGQLGDRNLVHLGGVSEEPPVSGEPELSRRGGGRSSSEEQFVFLAQDSHLIEVGPALTGQRDFLSGSTRNGVSERTGGIQVLGQYVFEWHVLVQKDLVVSPWRKILSSTTDEKRDASHEEQLSMSCITTVLYYHPF